MVSSSESGDERELHRLAPDRGRVRTIGHHPPASLCPAPIDLTRSWYRVDRATRRPTGVPPVNNGPTRGQPRVASWRSCDLGPCFTSWARSRMALADGAPWVRAGRGQRQRRNDEAKGHGGRSGAGDRARCLPRTRSGAPGRRPRPPAAPLRRDHPALPRPGRRRRRCHRAAGGRPGLADRHRRRRGLRRPPFRSPRCATPCSPCSRWWRAAPSWPGPPNVRHTGPRPRPSRSCDSPRRPASPRSARRPRAAGARAAQRAPDHRDRRARRLLLPLPAPAVPGRHRAGHRSSPSWPERTGSAPSSSPSAFP